MTNEELVTRIQKKIDVAENMLQLWQQNQGMICQMAGKYKHMAEKEDLQQEGYIALCDAVDHYDPDRGASFSTVLFQYLRLYLVRYCQNSGIVRVPVHTAEMVRKYQKLVSAFRQQVGRKPTDRKLCYYLQISEKELRTIQHAEQMKQIGSIDTPVGEDGETTLGDLAADETDIEGNVLETVQQEQLAAVIWSLAAELPEQQENIIRMRYQDGMTLQQAGQVLGTTKEAARKQESEAFRFFRRSQNINRLRPFLPETYEAAVYHGNGVQNFNRTWTSSTERVALQLIE